MKQRGQLPHPLPGRKGGAEQLLQRESVGCPNRGTEEVLWEFSGGGKPATELGPDKMRAVAGGWYFRGR